MEFGVRTHHARRFQRRGTECGACLSNSKRGLDGMECSVPEQYQMSPGLAPWTPSGRHRDTFVLHTKSKRACWTASVA